MTNALSNTKRINIAYIGGGSRGWAWTFMTDLSLEKLLGGEIRLFNTPLLSNNNYMNNYYEEDNSKIYISNGLGSIHHMRFMNHPSINVYRLISSFSEIQALIHLRCFSVQGFSAE